jgi:hypothetical protein
MARERPIDAGGGEHGRREDPALLIACRGERDPKTSHLSGQKLAQRLKI